MLKGQKEEIARICAQRVQFDEWLSSLTTFKIGGPADAVCFIHDVDTLQGFLRYLNQEGILCFVIGRGSNLLVNDQGFRGCVIILKGDLATVSRDASRPNRIKAACGIAVADLLNFCKQNGMGGLEFMAGIPGTLGGAITMNAGAWGQSIGDQVREITLVERAGILRKQPAAALKFAYRYAAVPEKAILAEAVLETTPVEPAKIGEQIKKNLMKRKAAQPLEQPSAGSVFKNPSGFYAGKLIEEAGLKGTRIGDAMVSSKHANFIVNIEKATAKDVLDLIALIQERVYARSGIHLETEIKVI
jgi:UDP-N-acetylmuramate dehydrogenase